MNTSPKIGPILVVAILGLTSLTLLTSAWGETTNPGVVQAAWSGMDGKRGDRLDAGGRGSHGPMWRCNAPGNSGPGGMHHGMGWRNPDQLAKRLNAMETEIGIRANQLELLARFHRRPARHHAAPEMAARRRRSRRRYQATAFRAG